MLSKISDTHPASLENPLSVRIIRAAIVLLATAVIAASGVVTMIGPQIMVTVPVAIAAGIFFAFRRSSWGWVCFGYPLIIGLISAWIGIHEIPGYETTTAFAVSLGMGLAGLGLIAIGLWKVVSAARKRCTASAFVHPDFSSVERNKK